MSKSSNLTHILKSQTHDLNPLTASLDDELLTYLNAQDMDILRIMHYEKSISASFLDIKWQRIDISFNLISKYAGGLQWRFPKNPGSDTPI